MKKTCEQCDWFYDGRDKDKPSACYKDGKWQKWIKKDSEDKPNNCPDFKNS